MQALVTLYQDRLPAKQLLDGPLFHNLSSQDRGLAMQLLYGVLRNRLRLDRILELLSTTKVNKLHPMVHQAIAIGLYQIFFLDRIPHSAAVNESVNCCRNAGLPPPLLGFVNGLLRASIRRREELLAASLTNGRGKPVVDHPAWLVRRWEKNYGQKQCQKICEDNRLERALVLRVNSQKTSIKELQSIMQEAGIESQPGSYSPDAVRLSGFRGGPEQLPGYREGAFQVQDEAAQLASYLLSPLRPGGRYLDACAGLGGKTSHLACLGADLAIDLHACEPEALRARRFTENLSRLGLAGKATLHQSPLEEFARQQQPLFDGVLVDAPCSGTGVIGRNPDIRWNRREEDLTRYRDTQLRLLRTASGLVAPGGTLVYATCSIEPEENQQVIASFLQQGADFSQEDCSTYLPPAARGLVHDKAFAPLPSMVIDGFFAAILRRRT